MLDPFLLALQAELEPQGILMTEEGELYPDPDYSGATPPDPDQLEYLNEHRTLVGFYSQVQCDWAAEFLSTIDHLVSGRSSEPSALRTVMFLRLHGFVVDFLGHHRRTTSLFTNIQPRTGSALDALVGAVNAVTRVRDVLTEDEQLYAEYRRHVDAHIWQGAYDLQWNKKQGQPRRTFTSKFTDRTYDVSDLNTRVAGVIKSHGSEMAIATRFATRLRPHASVLRDAIERLCA